MAILIFTIAIVQTVASCQAQGVSHPRSEHLVHHSEQILTQGLELFEIASASRDSVTIGSESGEMPYVFGRIVTARLLSYGVLVLDASYGEIRLFHLDGKHVATAGSIGVGPGELRNPVGMDVDPERDRVFIYESDGSIEEYEVVIPTSGTDGRNLRFVRTISTPVSGVFSGCYLGESFVLNSSSMGSADILHVVDAHSGSLLRSFGQFYDSSNDFLNRRISRGTLSCSRASQSVWFASQFVPEVYKYSLNGEVMGAFRFGEGISQAVSVGKEGQLTYRTPNESNNITSLVFTGRGQQVLVQSDVYSVDKRQQNELGFEHVRSSTVLIGLNSDAKAVSGLLGKILDMSTEHVLLLNSRPYPRLVLISYDLSAQE